MNLYIEYQQCGRKFATEVFPSSQLTQELRKLNHHKHLTIRKEAPEEPEECEHQWVLRDHSFSHEFGTKEDVFEECTECGKVRPPQDYEEEQNDLRG